jgi:hypothetical protein
MKKAKMHETWAMIALQQAGSFHVCMYVICCSSIARGIFQNGGSAIIGVVRKYVRHGEFLELGGRLDETQSEKIPMSCSFNVNTMAYQKLKIR